MTKNEVRELCYPGKKFAPLEVGDEFDEVYPGLVRNNDGGFLVPERRTRFHITEITPDGNIKTSRGELFDGVMFVANHGISTRYGPSYYWVKP